MEELKKPFTVIVYTENNLGLLNRIATIFLKRHISIDSLNVSESEIEGVHRFTIVAAMTEDHVKKIVGQIDKQIEVIKAFYHSDEGIIFQESALYKMHSDVLFDKREVQNVIKNSHARIVTVQRDYFVIEKTGHRLELEKLYQELLPYGLKQYVRSGRIAVSKKEMQISNRLKEFI
ncbi:acetolactate synthase small subunit [Flavobacteriaceae bacterium]|nr:acetolactate synthase small subunit [Flavobacteriaceae bacterium]